MYADYAPKGVKFYYIYKSLAHPETNGYIRPYSLKDRLLHVKEAQRQLGSKFSWICDTMTNDLKRALGDAPNSEYIIDPKGKIVRKRRWSRPSAVRADLEELVGKVKNPTTVADLKMKPIAPPKAAKSGVVKRVTLPGRMTAVKIKPLESKQPFYAKLRAEADQALLRNGKGSLLLSFRMDPLLHVHWNNLSTPISYEIEAPKGVAVTPAKGQGPKVTVAADIDPRDFLVTVDAADMRKGQLKLKVKYFACNDKEGWCKRISQEYIVHLQSDRDGGRRFNRGGFGKRPPRNFAATMIKRLKSFDKNKDGKITKKELPERMHRMLKRADTNNDDAIDAKELKQLEKRFRRFGGGRRFEAGRQVGHLERLTIA